MINPDIERWLADPHATFSTGKYLLQTFAPDSVSAALLASENTYSWRKLREALETALASTPTTQTNTRAASRHHHGKTDGYPPELVEMDRMQPIKYSELRSLANRTFDMPEGDELRDLAIKIVKLDKEIAHNWLQLDYFAQTGTIMPGTVTASMDKADVIDKLVDWLDRYTSLIDYVRKYRNSKDAPKKAEAARRQEELNEIAGFIQNYKNAH